MSAKTAWKLSRLAMGTFALDGGAMFGIVPKPLWQKVQPADERNRITMQTNCLLLQNGERNIVVEVGNGLNFDAKQIDQYNFQGLKSWSEALRPHGLTAEQITDVIVTHLHFDHADGLVSGTAKSEWRLSFPNATHYLQKKQLEWAKKPTERDQGSYKGPALWAFTESGAKIKLIDGDQEMVAGLRAQVISGHTPGQQLVHFDIGSDHYVFIADLTPTTAHFHLPWIMAYDLYPLESLKEKKAFLTEAAAKQWNLWLYHEPVDYLVRVVNDGKKFQKGTVLAKCD